MKRKLLAFAAILALTVSCKKESPRQLSPELQKALSDFELMDGFEIELFAAEPLVLDPVAMEVDENGDIYVVEMPGYPLDLSNSGKIKLLKDTDKDGFPDSSIVFAEGLKLPNGIQKWKKGVIVTDAPDVLYLEDTDGDGKADKKEVMLTGFALSNPQHNLNTPRFEADNWIYLGHEENVTPFTFTKEFGDEGTDITWPQLNGKKALGKNADSKMVRFKPDTFEAEELSGATQFGHTRDAWGHRLYTSNANHLFHEVIGAEYLKNNPNLILSGVVESIPDHGDACEVFPITENPNHQLLTDVGVVTSSCAVTWYLGGAFGDEFKNVTFVGEPVHNLVHADVIEDAGATFKAKRLLEKKEFLASKDPWFRPVNFYIGPDGALYVIDYYRQLIEHPEWMSDEVNKSGALYNGKDKGRIYRITKKGTDAANWANQLNLGKQSTEALAGLLDHSNIWYRRTAQRLLFQGKDASAAGALKKLLNNPKHDESKIHALWLLNDLKALDKATLEQALKDPVAGVKENALKLYEQNPYPELRPLVLKMAEDKDPKLAFQAINTLGRLNLLTDRKVLIEKAMDDKWLGVALLAASENEETALISAGIEKNKQQTPSAFFSFLAAGIANSGNAAEVNKLFEILKTNTQHPSVNLDLAKGLLKFWTYQAPRYNISDAAREYLYQNATTLDNEYGTVSAGLLSYTGLPLSSKNKLAEVAEKAFDPKVSPVIRANALSILQAARYPVQDEQLLAILDQKPADQLASRVATILIKKGSTSHVFDQWNKLPVKSKNGIIDLLSNENTSAIQLLTAIENKKINKTDIEWPKTVNLMNYYDEAVRAKARKVFSINEDRKAVLQQYLTATEQKGDAANGAEVFEKNCTVCHQKAKKGTDFGPDLSSLKNRNTHSILTEIINPNNSIADKFDYWQVTLKNKEVLFGIVINENNESLTINQMGGNKLSLKKSEIATKEKMTYSAMPNGLENSITVKEMADLIAFIKE